MAHAAYLCNRVPTRALNGATPFEAWTGEKPSVAHFHEFRCNIWVLDESKNRSKLSPKSKKMKFTRFMDGLKSICHYDAVTRSIKVSQNFAFNENDDLKELEIYMDLPDLVGIKGEDTTSNDSPDPTTTMAPDTGTPSLPPVNTAETPANTPITRPMQDGRKDLDYKDNE